MFLKTFFVWAGLAVAAAFVASPANALTMAECSAKYQAAKSAGTLNGMKWNDFRKAECGTSASTTSATTSTSKTTGTAKAETGTSKSSSSDAAGTGTGKGLTLAECSAKYQAAKSAGTLNGMKWNDFRKAECGAGASTAAATGTSNTTGTSKATTSSDSGAGTGKGLTMAECSAKYQAAKSAGTLNGMKWNDFRKAECGAGAGTAASTGTSKTTGGSKTATSSGNGAGAGKGLTMAECSAKYQAAKSAGTLKGMKWNDFRKAECGAGASEDDSVPSVDEASYSGEPASPTGVAPKGVVFPSAIAKKYAGKSAGKARMHTCLDQYYADKDNGTLGGLRWIQKGGGYYSLCNAKLKR